MSDTSPQPPAPEDDISDEELAAALALIKKRRADEARQREQQAAQQQSQQQAAAVSEPVAPVPVPRPAVAAVPASQDTVWPPAPRAGMISSKRGVALVPPELPAPILGNCPSCKRKLLTRTSALCNWCGAKINNPDYQEQAARTRQDMDDAIRQAAEIRAQDAPNRTVLGRLKRRMKPGGTSAPQT